MKQNRIILWFLKEKETNSLYLINSTYLILLGIFIVMQSYFSVKENWAVAEKIGNLAMLSLGIFIANSVIYILVSKIFKFK